MWRMHAGVSRLQLRCERSKLILYSTTTCIHHMSSPATPLMSYAIHVRRRNSAVYVCRHSVFPARPALLPFCCCKRPICSLLLECMSVHIPGMHFPSFLYRIAIPYMCACKRYCCKIERHTRTHCSIPVCQRAVVGRDSFVDGLR